MSSSKAQVWYADFMIGVLIFSIVIFAYFYYVERSETPGTDLQSALLVEAKSISSYLVSRGYPEDWTASNVTTIGLTDGNHRINSSKLASFDSLGYEERRGFLHTTKDYYFFLAYLNGTRFNELCSDEPGCVEWNTSYYLVQDTRLLIYDSQIIRMGIYVYQSP